MSIVAGIAAGILGLEGASGFLCFFIVMSLAGIGIFVKCGGQPERYFESLKTLLLEGFLQGGLVSILPLDRFLLTNLFSPLDMCLNVEQSFVLFWTYPQTFSFLL